MNDLFKYIVLVLWILGLVFVGVGFADTPVDDNSVGTATCAASGDGNPGALTITPTTILIELTNNDSDGCAITLSESRAQQGDRVEIWNISANSASIANSDNVQEVVSDGTITMAQHRRAVLYYTGSAWIVEQ